MAQEQSWGTLLPYRKAHFPLFPGMAAVIGPGVIFIFLPRHLPQEARPGRISLVFLVLSCLAYSSLAVAYLLTKIGII